MGYIIILKKVNKDIKSNRDGVNYNRELHTLNIKYIYKQSNLIRIIYS